MKTQNNIFDLAKILARSIQNDLNEKERTILNSWLEESSDHQILYDKIKDEKALGEKMLSYSGINWEEDYNNFIRRKQKQRKLVKLQPFMKYAAILVLPLAFAAYMLFFSSSDILKQEPVIINPGIEKARLIVSPDMVYDLEKNENLLISDASVKVENKEGVLVYKKTEQLKEASLKEEIHKLIIPRGGEWTLELSDGTKVWLNSETELKFPKQFLGDSRCVELVSGEAYFEVVRDADHPFRVKSASGIVEVLGTSFNIRSYTDEGTNVTTLVEGKVKLTSVDHADQSVILQPGDQALIALESEQINVRQVKTGYYTAWKDKRFEFNMEPLSYILGSISRWYDVEVNFKDEQTKNYVFSARLGRYDSIERLIEKIELTKKVKIEITHKGLVVSDYN